MLGKLVCPLHVEETLCPQIERNRPKPAIQLRSVVRLTDGGSSMSGKIKPGESKEPEEETRLALVTTMEHLTFLKLLS